MKKKAKTKTDKERAARKGLFVDLGDAGESDDSGLSAPTEERSPEEVERRAQAFLESRAKVRAELVPVPKIEGAEAEEWAENKKVALLPAAIAEIEYQLKYSGSDKARIEAARDVLDMNGMRKRDAPVAGGAVIFFNPGEGFKLPWKKQDVIDAKVVDNTQSASNAKSEESAVPEVKK